jgi:hypothetical protein
VWGGAAPGGSPWSGLASELGLRSTQLIGVLDPDPFVFGPPGSALGSVIHKYGSESDSRSGSGSFLFSEKCSD